MPGVPNIFANATTTIPLSQLDVNFATQITIGSTQVGLGNTVTSLAGLANIAFSGGNALSTYSTAGYTPTDQSGAGLVFSSVGASQVQIGSLVFCHGTVTYPVTANTSTATVSLPVASSSAAPTSGTAVNATDGTVFIGSIAAGSSNFIMFNTPTTTSAITNAALSGKILRFNFIYNTN